MPTPNPRDVAMLTVVPKVEGEPMTRPQPVSPNVALDFPTAIKLVTEGGRISRRSWDDPTIWLELRAGVLHIHLQKPDGLWHQAILNEGDLLGQDWFPL